EEGLAQGPRRPDPVTGEEVADLARRHRSTPKTRAALARVSSAISSTSAPRARASASPTATTNAGSFSFPRYGSGARKGESVSTRMRSGGASRAASRNDSAFLNETIPLNDK